MLEIILQNFQENNNIINVAANKKFMKSKNYIHHVLSIQRRFLITYKNYADNFEIIMINNCKLFMMFYSHLSLIKKVSFIYHADIFTFQNQYDNI